MSYTGPQVTEVFYIDEEKRRHETVSTGPRSSDSNL